MKVFSNKLSYITLCMGFLLSAVVAYSIGELRQESVKVQLKAEMKELSQQVSHTLFMNFEALHVLGGLFNGSSSVSADEFGVVAKMTLNRHPELRYLQWAELVPDVDRNQFEGVQQQRSSRYKIQELSDNTRWVPARPRGRHYPVVFHRDKGMVNLREGFDLASNPELNRAIEQAIGSGMLAVTAPQGVGSDAKGAASVIAVLPVYQVYEGDLGNASERFNALKGVVVGEFTLANIMRDAMMGTPTAGLHIALIDRVAFQEKGSAAAVLFARQPISLPVMSMQQRYPISDVGGRNWELVVAPSEGYMSEQKSELAYVVIMAGLLVSGMLAAYLRMLSRRSFEMESVAEQRNKALQEANKKLGHLSQTDGLTQIANRRFFDESFIQEWKRNKREHQPISLVLFDLDFFKQYNDQYGHLQGDECLRSIAELIGSTINRPGDLFARFGGEEFILLLPNTPEEGALKMAEQCRELVESLAITHHKSSISEVVTISVGLCSVIPDNTLTEHDMLDLTDQALYSAKGRGRNRVVSANSEGFTPRQDLSRKL